MVYVGMDIHFQYYLVAYIDLLGQRCRLRRIKSIPTDEAEKDEFLTLVRKTFGRVTRIRDYFKNFFDASRSHTPNVELVQPEHREQFIASQESEVHFYGISDAVVVCVPLMSDDENCTALNGVYSAFVATCGIGIMGLSAEIPVRAGIDVGIAAEIDEKEIYGPAFERAYRLESQVAEYPRFVLGKELLTYLKCIENQDEKTPLGQMAKKKAKFCREMIIRDTDGRYMLDFLGPKLKEAAGQFITAQLVEKARGFVESEFRRHSEQGNERLAPRYFRLLRYFQCRQSIWQG